MSNGVLECQSASCSCPVLRILSHVGALQAWDIGISDAAFSVLPRFLEKRRNCCPTEEITWHYLSLVNNLQATKFVPHFTPGQGRR